MVPRSEVFELLGPSVPAEPATRARELLATTRAERAAEPARFVRALLLEQGISSTATLLERADTDSVELRLDRRSAVQGAVLVAAVATGAGTVGLWFYGLVLGLATGLGVLLVATRFAWFNRVAAARLPRGRWLGVAVLLPIVAVVVVAVIMPIRAERRADIERQDAGRRAAPEAR